MICFQNSASSFGNTSLSSFLSTLMEEEEVSELALVVDNAKPDHNCSSRSLVLLEEEESKCRWNNLVRTDSNPSLFGRRSRASRSNRSSSNRPRMSSCTSTSDPSLMSLKMPRRTQSPTKALSKQNTTKPSNCSSDSDLLRMPRRLASPILQVPRNDSIKSGNGNGSMNASWNTAELKKRIEKTNLFLDVMVETGDLPSKGTFYPPSKASKGKGLSPSLKGTLTAL